MLGARETDWINPKHTLPSELATYAEQLNASPIRHFVIQDFLNPEIAEKLAIHMETTKLWYDVYGVRGKGGAVSHEDWKKAPSVDRYFHFEKMYLQPPIEHVADPGWLLFVRFKLFLENQFFRSFMQSLGGAPLLQDTEVTAQRLSAQHMLRPHNDRNSERRFAFIIYLSRDWRDEYGGGLRIHSRDGETYDTPVRFNQLVIFDIAAHHLHEIEPVTDLAPLPRLTIGGWV